MIDRSFNPLLVTSFANEMPDRLFRIILINNESNYFVRRTFRTHGNHFVVFLRVFFFLEATATNFLDLGSLSV